MYISFEINESGKEAVVKGVPIAGRKLTVRKATPGRPQTRVPPTYLDGFARKTFAKIFIRGTPFTIRRPLFTMLSISSPPRRKQSTDS